MRQLIHRCKQMSFLDQLRSSSAPDLTLAVTAVVPKGLVIIYLQGGVRKNLEPGKAAIRGFFMLGEEGS